MNRNNNNNRYNYGNANKEELRYQANFDAQGRILNPLKVTEELPHINTTVYNIFNKIFPELADNVFPRDYLNGVKGIYQQIKSKRASSSGLTKNKEMAGLSREVICLVAFHSILNDQAGLRMPVSMFLERYGKKQLLNKFQKYKQDRKIGMQWYFSRINPEYLEDKDSSYYLSNKVINILNLSREQARDIRRSLHNIESSKNKFNEFINNQHILYAVIIYHSPNVDTSLFGIPISKFAKVRSQIKNFLNG
tara:strand:+ start:334 stop:1083 length:750 start_codon:yes stop_codon:yes gene_type:complete